MGTTSSTAINENQTGGKYLGSGTHGCVFSPNMKCKPSDKSTDDFVSKLILKSSQKEEYDNIVAFNFNRLDPNSELFVYPSELCNITKEYIDKDYKRCDKFIDNLTGRPISVSDISKKYANIVQANGGPDMMQLQYNKTLFRQTIGEYDNKVILHFLNLFIGVAVFEKNKLAHRDIKPANVTVHNVKLMRLIDFGFTAKYVDNLFKELKSEGGPWDWAHEKYMYWPRDLQLIMSEECGGKYDDIQYLIRDTDQNKIFTVLTEQASRIKEECYESYWILNPKQNKNLFTSLLSFLIDLHTKDLIKTEVDKRVISHIIQSKWDVFMLGATLSEFISKTKWTSDSPKFDEMFIDLIIDMTSLHPLKRPTIKEALERFIKIIFDEETQTMDGLSDDGLDENIHVLFKKIMDEELTDILDDGSENDTEYESES